MNEAQIHELPFEWDEDIINSDELETFLEARKSDALAEILRTVFKAAKRQGCSRVICTDAVFAALLSVYGPESK